MAALLGTVALYAAVAIITAILWNLIKQMFPSASRPPVVFHWLPLIGSTVSLVLMGAGEGRVTSPTGYDVVSTHRER